jgi:COP9 signalosome complex subunit 3
MAKPVRGIPVIKTAISKIQLDVGGGNIRVNLLTAVHTDLLQLSLASMNFTPGLELLSHDILDIHKPANSHFDAKYLLSFFYYAGCLYAAVKDFEQALFYFEQVLTVPATCLSHIMIEAYKKLLVISLMSEGKIPVLPKYTSRIVLNQIKPICSVYLELAHAFLNYEQAKLTFLRLKHFETFAQDQMTGLVKQLEQSLYKKNIQKLTKTYITLSLEGMAEKVKLGSAKEAEHLMLNMIKDGEIFAKINQKDGRIILF